MGYDTTFSYFTPFRNDREKRDFVACGCAAGVAAAFGAPFGGVLFVLEEGASYWDQSLTWRTSFCALVATCTLTVVQSSSGSFSFGNFDHPAIRYQPGDLFLCVLMGTGGGLLGALFNGANMLLSKWRSRWIVSPSRRMLQVVFISVLVSCVSFGIPRLLQHCRLRPEVRNHHPKKICSFLK